MQQGKLKEELLSFIDPEICDNAVCEEYRERLENGSLTRDENPASHFCVYFLPLDAERKRLFLIHHKKANKWLSPGGHIDKGESTFETLNREIKEELGVADFYKKAPQPFLLTITHIENETQPCKKHFDIWFIMPTDGKNFNVDMEEFHDSKWMTFKEARDVLRDESNLRALDEIESYSVFKNSA